MDETCGVNLVFEVVGSKWKPTILWALGQRPHRFSELRREVGAISEKVLAQQLRELERDGLVHREAEEGFPLRVEYSLTSAGRTLDELLDPVAAWGHRHHEAQRAQREAGSSRGA